MSTHEFIYESLINSHSIFLDWWCFLGCCRCCWWCQKSSAATTQPSTCFHENRVGRIVMQNKGNKTINRLQVFWSLALFRLYFCQVQSILWVLIYWSVLQSIFAASALVKMFLLKVAFFIVVVWSIFPQFQNSRIPSEPVQVGTCSIYSGSSVRWWVWFILISTTKFPSSYSFKTGRPRQHNNTEPFSLLLPS